MSTHSLLISIRPVHAKKIFAGEKTVELRRTRPRISGGDTVLVYVSSPTKALIGAFEVERVIESNPEDLWAKVKSIAGLTESEFEDYYIGTDKAFGIMIKKTWHLEVPVALSKLKSKWKNFHPPQSYRYISVQEADLLDLNQI